MKELFIFSTQILPTGLCLKTENCLRKFDRTDTGRLSKFELKFFQVILRHLVLIQQRKSNGLGKGLGEVTKLRYKLRYKTQKRPIAFKTFKFNDVSLVTPQPAFCIELLARKCVKDQSDDARPSEFDLSCGRRGSVS